MTTTRPAATVWNQFSRTRIVHVRLLAPAHPRTPCGRIISANWTSGTMPEGWRHCEVCERDLAYRKQEWPT